MKKTIFFFLFFSLFISISYGQSKEDRNGNLIGFLDKSDFMQGKYKNWFVSHYDEYEPKKKFLKKIQKYLEGVQIKSFIGSWCHDSQRELPHFYKLMELTGFDFEKNYKMIGITRGKKTPDNLQEGYNIKHTPTFIFFRNGKEIGRYVEHARESIEKDFLKILKGKSYKHTYQK